MSDSEVVVIDALDVNGNPNTSNGAIEHLNNKPQAAKAQVRQCVNIFLPAGENVLIITTCDKTVMILKKAKLRM